MALTDTFVRQVKHTGSPAGDKHADGAGRYLLVKGAGKYWRLNYRHGGKRKTLAMGTYPEVSLAKARKRLPEARERLAEGIDPSAVKQAQKVAAAIATENTFEAVGREFHALQSPGWSPKYAARWIERMEKDLFPYIGRMTLPAITGPVLLDVLRKVEKRGANETAHSLRQTAGQVYRYGIQTGRCDRNPVADLRRARRGAASGRRSAEVSSPYTMVQLVRAGLGATVLPLSMLGGAQPSELLAARLVNPVLTRPITVATAVEAPQSPQLLAVKALLLSVLEQRAGSGEWRRTDRTLHLASRQQHFRPAQKRALRPPD